MYEPMLATTSCGTDTRRAVTIESLARTHGFDLKLDGIRVIAVWDGTVLTLTSRNGNDLTKQYPELLDLFRRMKAPPAVLDGEVMAKSNKFSAVNQRARLTRPAAIRNGVLQHPCTFFAFDLLELDGAPMVDLPWLARRTGLEGYPIPRTPWSVNPAYLTEVAGMGMEGVIAKRLTARYQAGRRSPDWVKFKVTHTLSVLAAGYVGESRDVSYIHMCLLEPGKPEPVYIGRVGTGWNAREMAELKRRLDNQEVLVMEIKCLSRYDSGELREPVFIGLRGDISPTDCTMDQLETVPKS